MQGTADEGIADSRLRDDILAVLDAGVDQPLEDEAFDALALRVFAYQFGSNPPYRRYCERRDRTPATVEHWTAVPPVPTAAFKAVDLVSGDASRARTVFLTSGTTRGAEVRGRHPVLDLELYRRSLLPNLRAHVFPDDARLPFLCLVPPVADQPDSSLAFMIDVGASVLGSHEAEWFVDVDTGLDAPRLIDRLRRAVAEGMPVALLGTTLAFVHLIERLAADGASLDLPAGSRLMDTGGFKGSGREIAAGDLLAAYQRHLGIPATHRVNEYGMTEMCSQFYTTVLKDHVEGQAGGEGHAMPPWVRTRAVDPDTLAPLGDGEVGILQHCDLANAGSVMSIQTEDLGLVEGRRFSILGRSPGAQPRGCSIAMDILLQDAAGVRR